MIFTKRRQRGIPGISFLTKGSNAKEIIRKMLSTRIGNKVLTTGLVSSYIGSFNYGNTTGHEH